MARTKNYQAAGAINVVVSARSHDPETARIELLPNPRSHRLIDLRPWLGRGLDDWAWAFASVIRALLRSGNFSVATLVHFNRVVHQ